MGKGKKKKQSQMPSGNKPPYPAKSSSPPIFNNTPEPSTLWNGIWSWGAQGTITIFLFATAITFMIAGYLFIADIFFVVSGGLFLFKFLSWQALKRHQRKTLILFSISIISIIVFGGAIIGNHYLNDYQTTTHNINEKVTTWISDWDFAVTSEPRDDCHFNYLLATSNGNKIRVQRPKAHGEEMAVFVSITPSPKCIESINKLSKSERASLLNEIKLVALQRRQLVTVSTSYIVTFETVMTINSSLTKSLLREAINEIEKSVGIVQLTATTVLKRKGVF